MSKRYFTHFVLLLSFTFMCIGAAAQGSAEFSKSLDSIYAAQNAAAQMKIKLLQFNSDAEDISNEINEKATAEQLQQIQTKLNFLDNKWNTCYPIWQADIAQNDEMLELTTKYLQTRQAAGDALAKITEQQQNKQNFDSAEKFVLSQDSVYKDLNEQAEALSFVQKLAPQLETLKAKEQLLFADVEKNYEQAKAVAAADTTYSKRMQVVEDTFVEIKKSSAEIQAAAYKPLIQRVKDYLLGFAAVAVLLMFINMVQTKIKAAKQARENAKKMKKMFNKDHQYPTI